MSPLFAVSQTLTYRFCVDLSILLLFSYPALTYYTVLQALLLRAFEHSDHLYPGKPDICLPAIVCSGNNGNIIFHIDCCFQNLSKPRYLNGCDFHLYSLHTTDHDYACFIRFYDFEEFDTLPASIR